MKNRYEIRGPVAVIFCTAPKKLGGGMLEVKVDTAKLEKAQAWPGVWYGSIDRCGILTITGSKRITVIKGFTSQQPQLCRVIAETPPGSGVIYNDGDHCNCTTDNLINIKLGWNYDESQKQPVKGVHWRPDKKRWEARTFFNSKSYYIGAWPLDKLEEANAALMEFKNIGPKEYFKLHPKKERINYFEW